METWNLYTSTCMHEVRFKESKYPWNLFSRKDPSRFQGRISPQLYLQFRPNFHPKSVQAFRQSPIIMLILKYTMNKNHLCEFKFV